jgi:RNA polymerase sigma-70 factor, ECF subfamily
VNTPTTPSDEELVGLLGGGDARALEFLYERYSEFIYSLALRITGDPQNAEEVLQDTFLQLWRKSYQFDSLKGSLIGWLLTITRNGAISRIRQDKNRVTCEPLVDDGALRPYVGASTFLEQYVSQKLVSSALQGLSLVQREAITLVYFDGLTCEEIAVRTGVPVGTIKARLRTALTTTRRALSSPAIRSAPRSISLPSTSEKC